MLQFHIATNALVLKAKNYFNFFSRTCL